MFPCLVISYHIFRVNQITWLPHIDQSNAIHEANFIIIQNALGLTALYRYWGNGDHFYTTNVNEIGTSIGGQQGNHGYTSEGTQCLIYFKQVSGTVPLYRYYSAAAIDHFYTTNANEIGTTTPGQVGNHGYRSEGIAGYCFPKYTPGTVPLYRYYNGQLIDHFYTTNEYEIGTTTPGVTGKHGYTSEGVACWVIPYYG